MIHCSVAELDVLGELLQLNVRQMPFRFPVHGELLEDRTRLAGVVAESLNRKGLIADASIAPELERLVGVFARGRLAIVMIGTAGRRSYCVRAAVDGSTGVVAEQHGEMVRFTPITPPSLVRSVVGLLPPMRPGPGKSVTITVGNALPTKLVRRGDDEDFSSASFLEDARPARNLADAQWAIAAQIAQRPRSGTGYFTVTMRGRDSREGEPQTVTWLDTDVGRYAIVPSTGPDGKTYATYIPADLARLEQNLTRLVNSLL